MAGEFVSSELASQPATWRAAGDLAPSASAVLPQPGEGVAVVGCGTSWFIAMSYAAERELAGHGTSDAFAGSEYPARRRYDRVVVISRSGTTTEIVRLLQVLRSEGAETTLLTAVPQSPAAQEAAHVVALPFADERSVVQTRFATSALVLLRSALGHDAAALARGAQAALEADLDALLTASQVTFVGTGPAVGLCHEAALKTREAAQFWSEAYPAMDYRHGPIAIAEPGRLVWGLGPLPDGLVEDIASTGATLVSHDLDPLAGLVVAQRFAVAQGLRRGLDPDRPRSLTRSVILPT